MPWIIINDLSLEYLKKNVQCTLCIMQKTFRSVASVVIYTNISVV